MQLKNKTAVVTGGASGFGAGIVKHFAQAGARVVLADIDEPKGEAAAEEFSRATKATSDAEVIFARVDVTDADQVQAAASLAVARFGGLDIMVNNAGIGQRPVALEDTPDEVCDALLAVNLRSVFIGCRAVLPLMKRQGHGVIINTASGIALIPRPNLVLYAATKGAVVSLTKGLAVEVAAHNIRVVALCPAAGDTPMLTEFMGGADSADGRAKFAAGLPLGRLVTGDDMGAAAVYLASDAAAMLTGTCLPVDGGRCVG